eukprot:TRINITY_DN14314_c0_g1_i1.p1 TRINITY_DN14314_c0_g1~~TRINITY_DN14314_c0_g1_i1.p1  ORF type:complete len:154 (+),score=14.73 TRINITY_DN14314_c0_g1_i1:41-463(+)
MCIRDRLDARSTVKTLLIVDGAYLVIPMTMGMLSGSYFIFLELIWLCFLTITYATVYYRTPSFIRNISIVSRYIQYIIALLGGCALVVVAIYFYYQSSTDTAYYSGISLQMLSHLIMAFGLFSFFAGLVNLILTLSLIHI